MNWFGFIEVEQVVGFLLVLFRIAGVFFAAPLLGNRAVPSQVKVIFSVALSIIVFPQVGFSDPMALTSDLYLLQLILQEVLIGVVMGFAAAIIFAAVQIAGEIVGMKIGFAIAQQIDPSNEGSAGLITSFYVILGGLIFLYLDGHHAILTGLIESFRYIPIGEGVNLMVGNTLNEFLVRVFSIAIKIAAPVLIVSTLLYVCFGFLAKISPQLNIYFSVGFILGPMLGILTLALSLPLFRYLMSQLTYNLDADMIMTVRALKGM